MRIMKLSLRSMVCFFSDWSYRVIKMPRYCNWWSVREQTTIEDVSVMNSMNKEIMKLTRLPRILLAAASLLAFTGLAQDAIAASSLKLHAVFTDHMVIQRDKPIKVWGFAEPGKTVHVRFGEEVAQSEVVVGDPINVYGMEAEYAGLGRWEVTFAAREASAEPTTLQVTDRQVMLTVEDILIGDVWVLYGQSNMAWPLSKTTGSDMARATADLPLLREFKIQGNEQASLQDDIRPNTLAHGGWLVSTRESVGEFSGIGYHFGAILQRALGVPIGLINAARGGAAIESMVPARKFSEDPLANLYAEHVVQRMAEFDPEATADRIWANQKARARNRNRPEPPRPDPNSLSSWNVPGKSPSDMASIYNGMLGVVQGLNLKGVLFHQGYNNAMATSARPRRYRVLTRLMIEGIREDFNEPDLAFGIIGFCAGADPQNVDNFEAESIDAAPFIREAQRLGLADVENQNNLVFIPGYDVIVPGLHPDKKREHGERAARWALAKIYPEPRVQWEFGRSDVELLSAEPNGDHFVLKFSSAIISDSRNSIPEGFSLAGADGKFYMAHARYAEGRGHPSAFPNEIRVWSPLVPEPVALRYAWARSPMGNLKMRGQPDRPFPSFRTDDWDWPESDDPTESRIDRGVWNRVKAEADERLQFRRMEEARRGVEVIERIDRLGK